MEIQSKYKTIIVVVAFIIILLNIMAYINTYVSEKYETQLIGIERTIDPIQLEFKKNKIKKQRIFIVGFSLVVLVSTIIILNKKQIK